MMASPDTAFSLQDKNILIVGGAGGIGRACALLADRLGAVVHLTGRNTETLGQVRNELSHAGGINSVVDLERADAFGPVVAGWPLFDGVVVASGISSVKPLRAQPPAELRRTMWVNFEAPALLLREMLRSRRLADDGAVVLIGSIAGSIGSAGHVAYSASKAALAGFARSFATEVAPRRIRVNTVSPGLVETDMAERMGNSLSKEQLARYATSYPLGLGRPADVAGAVAFLLCPASRWITGTDLVVDGGVSHT